MNWTQTISLLLLLTATHSLTCATTQYYSTTLNLCLTCPTGCASCCDENLCTSCNTGTLSSTQAMPSPPPPPSASSAP